MFMNVIVILESNTMFINIITPVPLFLLQRNLNYLLYTAVRQGRPRFFATLLQSYIVSHINRLLYFPNKDKF